MTPAHVSVEVERDGPDGSLRRRVAFRLGLRSPPEPLGGRRRLVPGAARVTQVDPAAPARDPRVEDTREFDDAVAVLVQIGHSRERARHMIAIRMGMPEEDVARLREAAR